MASRLPTIRQVAWISLVPQLAFMGLLIGSFYGLGTGAPFLYGMLTYLAISFLLKAFITHHHRKGMALVKGQFYSKAIPFFQKSYAFFSRKPWVDQYRYITLLDSSGISYREMALCNIGFCYSQTGDGKAAIQFYTQALQEFPQSSLARAALRMLRASETQ